MSDDGGGRINEAIGFVMADDRLATAYQFGVMLERKRLHDFGVMDGDVPDGIKSEVQRLVGIILNNAPNEMSGVLAEPKADIHPETIRAMRKIKYLLDTVLRSEYSAKVIQHDNRIIYTKIRDGRDYNFEISWLVRDIVHSKARDIEQYLYKKIAFMKSVEEKPTEDEYAWSYNPLDYAKP